LAPRSATIGVSPEVALPLTTIAEPLELYQDSSGGVHWNSLNHVDRNGSASTTFRGYQMKEGRETRSGLRATPIVMVGSGPSQVSLCVPAFWQNFPMAV